MKNSSGTLEIRSPTRDLFFQLLITISNVHAVSDIKRIGNHIFRGLDRYSDSQKHEFSCLLRDRFCCICPEPLELQKFYSHLFISVFKELSTETRFFQSDDKISWYLQKCQFSNKKLAIRKKPPFWKISKKNSLYIKSRIWIYI